MQTAQWIELATRLAIVLAERGGNWLAVRDRIQRAADGEDITWDELDAAMTEAEESNADVHDAYDRLTGQG